jgi:hypothetical protein
MRAIEHIAKILTDPATDPRCAELLEDFIAALDGGGAFQLSRLYDLNYANFEVALALLIDWRLRGFRQPPGALSQMIAAQEHKAHPVLY